MTVLARYAHERDVRLLHFHYLTDARFLLGLHRRLDVASIVSGYGYDVSRFPNAAHGLGRHYLRPIFHRFDVFLAMTEIMRQDLMALGCPEAKIRVHYHGSDTARFRWPDRVYARESPLNVLLCARMVDCKGHDFLLRALRRLDASRRHPFTVTFVGDGPLRRKLQATADMYGWRQRVRFVGHVPYASAELVEHYRDADIFAHPSTTIDGGREGVPGTIVEAMASALPVVATRHGGIPEVIDHGRHGLLVKEHDVAGLAEALESLMDDAKLRRRLGSAAARRAASEFDLHVRTAELERIYDELI